MTTCYVTALFIPKSKIFRPIDSYISYFHELCSSGIQIALYLDPSLKSREKEIVGNFTNIQVVEYTEIDRSFLPEEARIPKNRNIEKDTEEYFCIQLMKLALVARASSDPRINARYLSWIDFGIFHIVKDKEKCSKFLESYVPPEHINKILVPGCWEKANYNIWDSVVWRYCGGLLIGNRELWQPAYILQQKKLLEGLPRLTWEVNYWCMMEDTFEWYKADHNDSMILNLPTV